MKANSKPINPLSGYITTDELRKLDAILNSIRAIESCACCLHPKASQAAVDAASDAYRAAPSRENLDALWAAELRLIHSAQIPQTASAVEASAAEHRDRFARHVRPILERARSAALNRLDEVISIERQHTKEMIGDPDAGDHSPVVSVARQPVETIERHLLSLQASNVTPKEVIRFIRALPLGPETGAKNRGVS